MKKVPEYFLITILSLFVFAPSMVAAEDTSNAVANRQAQLKQQLSQIEAQIADQQRILDDQQKQSSSLARDVAILDAKIKEGQLSIKARNLTIEQLNDDIGQKQVVIDKLSGKLDNEKESLAQIVRKTNELDGYSLTEFVLTGREMSDFFADVQTFQTLKESLQTSLGIVTDSRSKTQKEKETLQDKKNEQQELLQLQKLEQKRVEQDEKDKQKILKQSRGLETVYQTILKKQQQSAAQIRAELFQLQGSAAIPFGTAYQYAKEIEGKLGIRAAFLLGIIAEESNLGQNVGTGNWRTDMSPTRDQPVFQQICQELGLNPDTMPVSKKAWYGWGGAMGPAQFIPSTWILYKDRIAKVTGSNPPNPWNPRDAFYASALLSVDNGAANGTRASERLAALRYLAGWKNATKKAYAFYGNEVMDLADKFQRQIDILNQQ